MNTKETRALKASSEASLLALSRAHGAIYYYEVGPTGAWNVFGDVYDWAAAHPEIVADAQRNNR